MLVQRIYTILENFASALQGIATLLVLLLSLQMAVLLFYWKLLQDGNECGKTSEFYEHESLPYSFFCGVSSLIPSNVI